MLFILTCTRVSIPVALTLHGFTPEALLLLRLSSAFLFPASIVTVIRLVNDAVDDIESEGMSGFLCTRLSLLRLPPGAFTGVGLGHGVLNATEAFFFFQSGFH